MAGRVDVGATLVHSVTPTTLSIRQTQLSGQMIMIMSTVDWTVVVQISEKTLVDTLSLPAVCEGMKTRKKSWETTMTPSDIGPPRLLSGLQNHHVDHAVE